MKGVDVMNAISKTLTEAPHELEGQAVSSVEFVQDYLQLRFDGPSLTAYTLPTISSKSSNVAPGEAGYRDALCERIGHPVKATNVDEKDVSLLFDDGVVIRISLRDQDYKGPEALQLGLDKHRSWVV
jgi:hypothetical protein